MHKTFKLIFGMNTAVLLVYMRVLYIGDALEKSVWQLLNSYVCQDFMLLSAREQMLVHALILMSYRKFHIVLYHMTVTFLLKVLFPYCSHSHSGLLYCFHQQEIIIAVLRKEEDINHFPL